MKLILASGSERRNHLLSWLGIPFEVVESGFDESLIDESDPEKLVEKLALEKAQLVSKEVKDALVIGADTVGYIDGEILGKPKDAEDAVRFLKKLSGRKHEVYTGVAVIDSDSGKELVVSGKTEVTFRKLMDKEIRDYVATGEPLDKGAAYAIQMGARGFVSEVRGSYTNVVGLPMVLLVKLLEEQGYSINKDVSKIVFEKTGYWS